MELQVIISRNEVIDFQREYRKHICSNPRVKKSELAWITEQAIKHLSQAASLRGEWAVSDTLRPAVIRALSPFALSDEPANILRDAELIRKKQDVGVANLDEARQAIAA